MLAQNLDRSFEGGQRPKCAHFGQRLIAYDFELCFSFVYLIFNPNKAWEVASHGMGTKHVFHRQLRAGIESGKIGLRPVVEAVATLDIDELIQAMQSLPAEWVKHADKIEAHLKEVVANTRAFELELYRSLT